ncbi:MAG: hypothetical protein U0822_27435 [Anaerolineae bacterium]
MQRPLSRFWLRALTVLAALAGLMGLALVVHWLSMPATPAEASPLAFQMTATVAPPFIGPPRRNISPITPPPTPPSLISTPVTFTPTPTRTPIGLSETPVTPTPGVLQETPVTPASLNIAQVGPVLLAEAERRQNMQFNPNAALQKRIFADGLVPNSPEFRVSLGGVDFGGQRAESLASGLVRVYFVMVPNFANVAFVQRPNPRNGTEAGILAAGENAQVIQFNPNAALQKRMFGDGFVPNSSEFQLAVGGVPFVGQRGERLDTGEVRVYFVRDGDFANVFFFTRP